MVHTIEVSNKEYWKSI